MAEGARIINGAGVELPGSITGGSNAEGNSGDKVGTSQDSRGIKQIDPATVAPAGAGDGSADSGPAPSEPRKGRGNWGPRKAKAGAKVEQVKPGVAYGQASLSVDALNDLLFSIHMGIAAITHTPEFALDVDESRKLATASANVMRHYNVKTTAKAMDWIQLSIALGVIYAPRVMVISMKRAPRQAQPQPRPTPQPAQDSGVVTDPALMAHIIG